MPDIAIESIDPTGAEAVAWSAALWGEIQRRYDFVAASRAAAPAASTWRDLLAARQPSSTSCTSRRTTGVAASPQRCLTTLLDHAQRTGVHLIRLRAGSPQPEALAFYRDAGFVPTEPFGRWVEDPTAVCFALELPATGRS